MANFLDLTGLSHFWDKVKAYVDSAISTAKTAVGNYTINGQKISTNPVLTKANLNLGNVTNDAQVKRSEMGVAGGVATLTGSGKLTDNQLPNYIDTMLEFQIPTTLASPNLDIKPSSAKEAEYIVYIESKNVFCAYYNGVYYANWGPNDNVADADKYGDVASDNKGRVPKTGILYLNKTDLKNYKYDGSTKLVEIYQGGMETITTGEIDDLFSE